MSEINTRDFLLDLLDAVGYIANLDFKIVMNGAKGKLAGMIMPMDWGALEQSFLSLSWHALSRNISMSVAGG